MLFIVIEVQDLGVNEFYDRVCDYHFVHLHNLKVSNLVNRSHIRGYFALQQGSYFTQESLHTDVTWE